MASKYTHLDANHESDVVDVERKRDGSLFAQGDENYKISHATMAACVSEYTEAVGIHPDLVIRTSDGGATAAHQYVLANNSLYFFHRLEQDFVISEYNELKVIREESITKEGLEFLLHVLYRGNSNGFQLDAAKMEKISPEVVVASVRYFFPKYVREACAIDVKKSITLHNCGQLLEALDICEEKYCDVFYRAQGLRKTCEELLADY